MNLYGYPHPFSQARSLLSTLCTRSRLARDHDSDFWNSRSRLPRGRNLPKYRSIPPAFSCELDSELERHAYFQFAITICISCTKTSPADAKLDAPETWFSTALTDCHGGGYIGGWRSRARFGGKLDSERTSNVISKALRERPLDRSSTEARIAFFSHLHLKRTLIGEKKEKKRRNIV